MLVLTISDREIDVSDVACAQKFVSKWGHGKPKFGTAPYHDCGVTVVVFGKLGYLVWKGGRIREI